MDSRLAALYPNIKTYSGKGLDDSSTTARFAVTPAGFHGIVLSNRGTVIVEPVAHGSAGEYVSYEPRDAPKEAGQFSCLLSKDAQTHNAVSANLGSLAGTKLRTYRLALAEPANTHKPMAAGR